MPTKSAISSAHLLVNKATVHTAPPLQLSVSDWADTYRVLSSESGALPGPWRTLRFQREIFDCFSDPRVESVVIMSATQMVKSETLLNAIGWVIDIDPGPMLIVLPRDSDVEKFSKIRLSPMIRDSTSLRTKVRDQADKHSGDTIFHKSFPGGHLTIAASGSPANLSALPIRYLLLDECDKYPATAGSEGDPISLASKRVATFHNRKIVMCSSPTVEGESRISKAYGSSDQRRFEVPCPKCGQFQVLAWARVRWDTPGTDAERARTATYACHACDASWSDLERWKAVEQGRWIANAPFTGSAGFWISELYSPWKRLSDIVSDFLQKRKDPEMLRTFINTSLAETWRQQGERPEWRRLHARRESYPLGVVPSRGLFLTAAVDVQADRLEVEVVAWGRRRECWSVVYEVIPGDPTNTSAAGPWWRRDGLHSLLTRSFPTADGGQLQILCMAIDSGFRPQPVYDFARRNPQPIHGPAGSKCLNYSSVAATKGTDRADQLIVGVSSIDVARQQRSGVRIWSIGTHFAKQQLYDLLRLEPNQGDGDNVVYPDGYVHLPDYGTDYFKGLVSETRVVRSSGRIEWVEDGGVRNEPLDLACLNRASAEISGISRLSENDWQSLEQLYKRPTLPDAKPTNSADGAPSGSPAASRIRWRFDI